jgi:hypothetical protein
MAASIRQWDTDWFDQFKTIMPTSFSNLQVYPDNPIAWMNIVNVPFGNKQAQRAIRMPDQDVQVAKEVKYLDKYAARQVQVADMPALFDSLRIEEEYYAGDTVNALGHVGDLFQNFNDALANFVYTGTDIEPISYGLMDAGGGTGTISRPDQPTAITSAGEWDVQGNIFLDLAAMENGLVEKGFFGPKRLIAPPLLKPWLSAVLTSTATPYRTWLSSIAGYPITFTPIIDPNATTNALALFMVDESSFDLFMTPLKVRGFFDSNTEDFVWHWKTRAYLLARPLHDGTEWLKGAIQIAALDLET